jgi:ABC-2 type transport system ATP-binding protein
MTIEARGVTRRFGDVEALAGIDLVMETGEVMAVLGPNGSGKTTFVRLVATLLHPSGGSLRVAGLDVVKDAPTVRKLIGLAGQFAAVEPAMTGRENLEMFGRLYGQSVRVARSNANRLLEIFSLTDQANRLTRTYSGGMRRKLDLGASLIGAPRLLLLDEPTTGLDPRARLELWDAIGDLVQQGTDVLLTTQYLDEADRLASRLVIIDHGRAVANGTPAELKGRVGGNVLEVMLRDRADVDRAAQLLAHVTAAQPQIDRATGQIVVSIGSDMAGERFMGSLHALESDGLVLAGASMREPELDEVFLALTGNHGASAPATSNGGVTS